MPTLDEDLVDSDLDYVNLVPGQGESEGDSNESAASFKASISGKDWTVETLVYQMRKGRIDLEPTFQRRNAWLANRKSKLIESIMLGFPIPQIVLAEKPDKKGHYFVLDGKQRLLALRQFFVNTQNLKDAGFEALNLTGLEVLPELNGNSISDLDKSQPELLASVENHSIRTVVLGDWNSENLLLSLFLRLNTGSVALSPQELRQALIHGEFMNWLDKESGDSLVLRDLLNNTHPDRRMVDAELFLRHLSFSESPYMYNGNLKEFLDKTSRYFNSSWSTKEQLAAGCLTQFSEGLRLGMKEFGRTSFGRKWTGNSKSGVGKYERALNRAVFDVQAYSLSIPEVRVAVSGHAVDVLHEYQKLCEQDEAFVRSISATTKTAEAFSVRHEAWRGIIRECCGLEYPLPRPLTSN
jgi:hypothetical protein